MVNGRFHRGVWGGGGAGAVTRTASLGAANGGSDVSGREGMWELAEET